MKGASLDIQEGEIIALLGPNGAGKTTLISTICGISSLTSGRITVAGMDIGLCYRKVRAMIGLVPQEIALEPFETVINSVRFSRGLFGKAKNEAYLALTRVRVRWKSCKRELKTAREPRPYSPNRCCWGRSER